MNTPPTTPLDTLTALELELQRPEVRASRARLEALLHPDFEEVGRSGRRYTRDTLVAHLLAAPSDASGERIESSDFAAIALGDAAALLTYASQHRDAAGAVRLPTRRVSLWLKNARGEWQLRYHQGTPVPDAPTAALAADTASWTAAPSATHQAFAAAAPSAVISEATPAATALPDGLSSSASLTELASTVERLQTRLAQHPAPAVQAAYRQYLALLPRFAQDLGHAPRDQMLACASALILVQAVATSADEADAAVGLAPGGAAPRSWA